MNVIILFKIKIILKHKKNINNNLKKFALSFCSFIKKRNYEILKNFELVQLKSHVYVYIF
jgi:hypothetical protein